MRCPSDEFIKCAIIEPLMLKLVASWMGVRFDSQIDWLAEWFARFCWLTDSLTLMAQNSCGLWPCFWPSEIDITKVGKR